MSETAGPLTISTTTSGISVSGEIDASTVEMLSRHLVPLPGTASDVEIDMSAVEFIDSSGLRVLIQAHQRADADARRLVITNPSSIVARLFEVSGLTELFTVRSGAN